MRVYKAVNAAAKADEAVLAVCKGELVKLQQGDAENLGIWKECVRLTLEQLEKVYSTLDIQFDHYLGESFYNDALAPLVEDMLAKGIAQESDGAIVVMTDGSVKPEEDPFLIRDKDEWKAAPCIIRKSDGGFLYATTDLATIDYRVKEWNADQIWYVVGAPQQLHFRQVFAAAKRRGVTTEMTHIAFGSILGPDGKMFKTRSGETVGLLEVIDEAIERARAAADEKEQGFSDRREGRDRPHHRLRLREIRRTQPEPPHRLQIQLGQNAEPARQHRALPAQRLRPHAQHLPQARWRSHTHR